MNTTKFSSAFFFHPITEPNSYSPYSALLKSDCPARRLSRSISVDSTHTQSIQTPNFYLDTFFNFTWMSDPHVFSFNPDEVVKFPKTARAKVPSMHNTCDAEAKSALSHGFANKPWKNVAITEHDDAEFEELQARLASAEGVTDDGLIYTWPPDLVAHQREVEEERGPGDAAECADDNVAPAVPRRTSPSASARIEDSSPMIPTPTRCGTLAVLHDSPEDGALEKIVGLKRLRRKAPPPLCLDGNNQAEDAIDQVRCILLNGDGENAAHKTRVSFLYFSPVREFDSNIPLADVESADGSDQDHQQVVCGGLLLYQYLFSAWSSILTYISDMFRVSV